MNSSAYKTKQIETGATNIRKHILKIALDRGGCYLAQACSSAEILSSLYMGILNPRPKLGIYGCTSVPRCAGTR